MAQPLTLTLVFMVLLMTSAMVATIIVMLIAVREMDRRGVDARRRWSILAAFSVFPPWGFWWWQQDRRRSHAHRTRTDS